MAISPKKGAPVVEPPEEGGDPIQDIVRRITTLEHREFPTPTYNRIENAVRDAVRSGTVNQAIMRHVTEAAAEAARGAISVQELSRHMEPSVRDHVTRRVTEANATNFQHHRDALTQHATSFRQEAEQIYERAATVAAKVDRALAGASTAAAEVGQMRTGWNDLRETLQRATATNEKLHAENRALTERLKKMELRLSAMEAQIHLEAQTRATAPAAGVVIQTNTRHAT